MLLVARREDRLRDACEEIRSAHPNVQAEYACFDFSRSLEDYKDLMVVVRDKTNNDIAVVIHMAGNSDLAKHLIDKPLERHIELVRLQVEGTLMVLHQFCQIMFKRSANRGAIMTSGALPAYFAQPGFAVAAGNKSFVRNLTHSVAFEFRERIDIMCAHPIAVRSEIVKQSSNFKFFIIEGREFAHLALQDFGVEGDTNGPMLHDLVTFIFRSIMPDEYRNWFFHSRVQAFGKILQREVDNRSLQEKLQV